jgi:hypothetical protein
MAGFGELDCAGAAVFEGGLVCAEIPNPKRTIAAKVPVLAAVNFIMRVPGQRLIFRPFDCLQYTIEIRRKSRVSCTLSSRMSVFVSPVFAFRSLGPRNTAHESLIQEGFLRSAARFGSAVASQRSGELWEGRNKLRS